MKTARKPSSNTSPESLLNDLKSELARVYGLEFAALCQFHYHRGWFYFSMPRRFQSDQLELDPLPRPYKREEFQALLEELRSR